MYESNLICSVLSFCLFVCLFVCFFLLWGGRGRTIMQKNRKSKQKTKQRTEHGLLHEVGSLGDCL